jgi:HK97 family phage major capsid protein
MELSRQAEVLAKGGTSQRDQAKLLSQRIGVLKSLEESSDELRKRYTAGLSESLAGPSYRSVFDRYVAGQVEKIEKRDFAAGTQTIAFTEGIPGGYTVPVDYDDTLRIANAQADPILDPDVTSFTMNAGPFLQPRQLSGYDLSTAISTVVGETVFQAAGTVPQALGAVLRSDIAHRVTLASSFEAEDDIPAFSGKIVRAVGVMLGRGMSRSVMAGKGGADCTGVTATLSSSGTNATPGKIVNTDITTWHQSIDRFYRASPKCAWMLSNSAYTTLRNAVDNSGRPLLNLEGGDEMMLMGHPVYISPSLENAYSSIGNALLFGDLSHLVIRCGRPTLQRTVNQSVHGAEYGQCEYIARLRGDGAIFDPSGGTNPPIRLFLIQ